MRRIQIACLAGMGSAAIVMLLSALFAFIGSWTPYRPFPLAWTCWWIGGALAVVTVTGVVWKATDER